MVVLEERRAQSGPILRPPALGLVHSPVRIDAHDRGRRAPQREDRGGDIVQPSTGEALTNGNEATRRRGAAFLAGEDLADAWLGLGARRALEAQFREYVDGAGIFNFPST